MVSGTHHTKQATTKARDLCVRKKVCVGNCGLCYGNGSLETSFKEFRCRNARDSTWIVDLSTYQTILIYEKSFLETFFTTFVPETLFYHSQSAFY